MFIISYANFLLRKKYARSLAPRISQLKMANDFTLYFAETFCLTLYIQLTNHEWAKWTKFLLAVVYGSPQRPSNSSKTLRKSEKLETHFYEWATKHEQPNTTLSYKYGKKHDKAINTIKNVFCTKMTIKVACISLTKNLLRYDFYIQN